MALRHDMRDPGVSLKWEARIKVLERELNISTVDAIADLLRDVEQARREIKR
jgi:hypothetical protein